VAQIFKTLLENAFGETFEEGYYNGEGWEVSIAIDSANRRTQGNKYYAKGLANIYPDGQFWSTAPFAQGAFVSDFQANLRSHGFDSANVTDYPWPLVAGDTLFTFGYVQPNSVDVSLSEEHSEAAGDGAGLGIGALIAMILGAIAIISLVSIIVYREWSRRQIPIGHVHVVDDVQGQTVSSPGLHVDHVAKHQPADVDASLSELSETDDLESSEEMFTDLTLSGSLATVDSFDDESSEGLSTGMNSTSDELLDQGDPSSWDHGDKDLAYSVQFFEGEDPVFKRSASELSTVSSGSYTGSSAPSA